MVSCERCGDFWLSVGVNICADGKLAIQPDSDRLRLSCVLAERRLKKLTGLFIGTSKPENPAPGRVIMTIEELLDEYPKKSEEFFDRALMNLTRMVENPAQTIKLGAADEAALFAIDLRFQMVSQLVDLGYIAVVENYSDHFQIKGKGWKRASEILAPNRDSDQAFVAMWFNEDRRQIFEDGIRPAIESDGKLKALRIDLKEHNEHIDDEIIAEIRRSRFMVADFTGHRGGVYYEAGFAAGLGIPVIFCIDGAETNEPHFDTRQFNRIIYSDAEDLRLKLTNRIRATIV